MQRICDRLREIRSGKGVLSKNVAGAIGVSAPYYVQMEKGDKPLKADYVQKAAAFLGVSISDLYGEKKKSPPQIEAATDEWTEDEVKAAQYLMDNNLLSSAARFAEVLSGLSADGLDHLEAFLRDLRKQNPESIPDGVEPKPPGEPE